MYSQLHLENGETTSAKPVEGHFLARTLNNAMRHNNIGMCQVSICRVRRCSQFDLRPYEMSLNARAVKRSTRDRALAFDKRRQNSHGRAAKTLLLHPSVTPVDNQYRAGSNHLCALWHADIVFLIKCAIFEWVVINPSWKISAGNPTLQRRYNKIINNIVTWLSQQYLCDTRFVQNCLEID